MPLSTLARAYWEACLAVRHPPALGRRGGAAWGFIKTQARRDGIIGRRCREMMPLKRRRGYELP